MLDHVRRPLTNILSMQLTMLGKVLLAALAIISSIEASPSGEGGQSQQQSTNGYPAPAIDSPFNLPINVVTQEQAGEREQDHQEQDRQVQNPLQGYQQHPLQDYQQQLMLLEQQNKRRLLMANQDHQQMPRPPTDSDEDE